MSEYSAPLKDMQFVLRELIDLPGLLALPGYEGMEADVLQSVLEQAGAFAAEVLSPLNRVGDHEGSQLRDGRVVTPEGWRAAYARFIEDGWSGTGCPTGIGGHGMPAVIAAHTDEMWHGANAAFALCPMLTRSAIEAIELAGSELLKRRYLPNLVSGRWTGTMNLTEPQAGSDLAAIKTRATPQRDGSFRINGQKIFITYGEHDLTENIVHMVLARTPDSPPGVKGISLFLVPKILTNDDGSLREGNDLRCLSIEHKLGIHASPTCVMQYGGGGSDAGAASSRGAVGWLVGEENRGLEYMFIMMNMARFSVGIQGLGLAERAYQQALGFARERRQGSEAGTRSAQAVPIIRHADVRRMLLTMRSTIEAIRALAAVVAEATDHARANPDPGVRARAEAFMSLLIPVIKGWSTECAVTLTSVGVQVHGGMGFIEETGAAQYLRDARITTIYEGTTGIQANDLVGRKIVRDGGQAAFALIGAISQVRQELSRSHNPHLGSLGRSLERGIQALDQAVRYVVEHGRDDIRTAQAGAEPLLNLMGIVAGGWQLARGALAAERHLQTHQGDLQFYESRILVARFFGDSVLPRASGLAHAVVHGAESILGLADEQF
jgi:alkylation response protein AidB-like acyl-CoA dehydrogenase